MTWGDDALRLDELVPTGGTWSGVLFENERTGFPLSLVWQFNFCFGEIDRDFGSTDPALSVDWVPLPGADWSAMEGRSASASQFAEPIESSVYFFEHHRFDAASARVLQQAGTRIRVAVEMSGDIDDLGLADLSVEAWLDFDGIYVQPPTKPASIEAAAALLANFTDPTGLSGVDRSHKYVFRPGGASSPSLANTSDFGSI